MEKLTCHPLKLRFVIPILFSLPFLWTSSCKKPHEPELIKLHPEFMEYTYFKDSTYWIYQDSATGNIDSFSVHNSRILIEEDNVGRHATGEKREVYIYQLVKNNFDSVVQYTGGSICSRNHEPLEGVCFYAGNIGTTYFMYLNKVGEKKSLGANTTITTMDVIDLFELNGHIYHKVTKVLVEIKTSTSKVEFIYHVAKNHGIIRKETINSSSNTAVPKSQVLELVRSHIVQ